MEDKPVVDPSWGVPDRPARFGWLSSGAALILVLIALAAIGNFFGTWLLYQLPSMAMRSNSNELLLSSAIGLLVGQACLISMWLTLGCQSLLARVSMSLGVLFGLSCLYILTLSFCDGSRLPGELPLIVVGLAFGLVGLLACPLAMFRWRSKRVISREDRESEVGSSQFGILHLFIATTITALLIPLAQQTFPSSDFDGNAPWDEILSFFMVYMLLSCLLSLLALAFVFDPNRRRVNFALLFSAVLIGGSIAGSVMALSFNTFYNSWAETVYNSIAFSAFLSCGLVCVLALFYSADYRLQRA